MFSIFWKRSKERTLSKILYLCHRSSEYALIQVDISYVQYAIEMQQKHEHHAFYELKRSVWPKQGFAFQFGALSNSLLLQVSFSPKPQVSFQYQRIEL